MALDCSNLLEHYTDSTLIINGWFLGRRNMKLPLLVLVVIAIYVLHQDFWFWRTARPLIFGFLPIGLFYHALFSVAASGVMWLLVKYAWPSHLEQEIEELESEDKVR